METDTCGNSKAIRDDHDIFNTSTPCLKKVDHFYFYDNFGKMDQFP